MFHRQEAGCVGKQTKLQLVLVCPQALFMIKIQINSSIILYEV